MPRCVERAPQCAWFPGHSHTSQAESYRGWKNILRMGIPDTQASYARGASLGMTADRTNQKGISAFDYNSSSANNAMKKPKLLHKDDMMPLQYALLCSRRLCSLLTCGIVLFSLTAWGCQTAYYETMEKLGYHKRDLMVSDVKKARDAQQEAKEQFKSALDRFTKTLNIPSGQLQEKYDVLNTEYERSEAKAQSVRDRIASVEDVSEALFKEWNAELKEYSSDALRKNSQRQLTQTRTHYAQLIKAMKRAETKMDPVLAKFKDQVLFLKHNLNAQTIASLKGELISVEGNVDSLIKELNASIKEADSFIASMAKDNA